MSGGARPASRTPGRGRLFGLGLGPGDPELITLRALRVLRAVPTLLVPARHPGGPSYALTIAEPHLTAVRQRIVKLAFPQGLGEAALEEQWERHAERVLDVLADGDAAFLTEGDPLFYGSFLQLVARLRRLDPELPIEVVPGVTAMSAAAAAAGERLVSRGERLAVLPAVYGADDLRQVLASFDTVVLLKVNRVLEQVLAVLDELGLAEQAFLVERCGRPEQRIVRGLATPPGEVDYFSLVVARGGGNAPGRGASDARRGQPRESTATTREGWRTQEIDGGA